MEIKTKFVLTHAALAIIAVVAVGGAYETYSLKAKVDKIPTPLTLNQTVEKAVSDQYTAYFQQSNVPAKVDDGASACVQAAATQFTCKMRLVNTSTGKTLNQTLTVTYTESSGVTKVVEAK